MRRSDAWRRIAALAIVAWGALIGRPALAQLMGQPLGRLIDVVEVDEHQGQVDITVSFNCSMRYLTHLPASRGRQIIVTLQPLPDCGLGPLSRILAEIPPISGAAHVVSSVRLDSNAPGLVTLTVGLAADEQFVLGQGVDPHGLRIRLIRAQHAAARVMVGGPTDEVSFFEVNLDSQLKPFPADAVSAAQTQLRAPVFVSQTLVEGRTWYRLRAGPFERRADAQQLLSRAVAIYPRAWLAVGHEAAPPAGEGAAAAALAAGPALPPVEQMGTDPPLDPGTLSQLLAQAGIALKAKDYPTAIRILTRLQRQPEFPGRARAQEMLGLARERAGQLAQAQAEYEEYLRRYPDGAAAAQVAERLRILRAATLPNAGGLGAIEAQRKWQVSGDVGQQFRYDSSRTSTSAQPSPTTPATPTPTQTENQDGLYTDVDFFARRHGDTSDWVTRLSAGYDRNFGSSAFSAGGLGNSAIVSLASVEYVNRAHGVLAQVGRQVRNDDGILGTFDGLFGSYHFRPAWTIDVAAGYPVDLLTASPQTRRRFESLALDLTPPGAHWDGSLFATVQTLDGVRDRRAVGLQGRYLASRGSLVALADYDVAYHSLNAAMLLGTLQLPARWSLNFDAERRNSPVLTTENALIGQPFTSFLRLEQSFTLGQIYQLARDRTPATEIFNLTVIRPLGERFELAATAGADRTAATVASGGVQALPATGLETSYQAQIYGSSLWSAGDFNVLTLTYSNTQVGKVEAAEVSTRLPLVGSWRIGPQLGVDHSKITGDTSTETTVDPSILIDYEHGLALVQLELGGAIGRQSSVAASQRSQRYFVGLSYRLGFQP
jgi:tetratricopeptide (TPR) repeat protein